MLLYYTVQGSPPVTVKLNELGVITIASIQTQGVPAEFPTKQVVTMTVKIDSWQDSYSTPNHLDGNFDRMLAARQALENQAGELWWAGDGFELGWGDQTVYLNSDGSAGGTVGLVCNVVSHDLPENPNAWGYYNQQLTIVFRYEQSVSVFNTGKSTHIAATFTPLQNSDGSPGTPLVLGNVTAFKTDYKATRFNQFRKFRERVGGNVSMQGEFITDVNGIDIKSLSLDDRRTALQLVLDKLNTTMEGASGSPPVSTAAEGTLLYQTPQQTNPLFSHIIRVDDWRAEVDQAAFCIKWSIEGSYTQFPLETGYAAAEYALQTTDDREAGESMLSITGRVMAANRTIAVAKLTAIKSAALSYYGFTEANLLRNNGLDEKRIDVDDMVDADRVSATGAGFIELSFSYQYRKKMTTIVSFTLNVSSAESSASGLIQQSYAGSVVASGSTYSIAFATALAKAQALGDGKSPIQTGSRIIQAYRQVGADGPQELVRLDFSYDYQVKGTKLWLEVTSGTEVNLFEDDRETCNGFVVASTLAIAQTKYTALVKNALYSGRVFLHEDTKTSTIMYDATGAGANPTLQTMGIRLEFSLIIRKLKGTGYLALKYGVEVDADPIQLLRTTSVRGRILCSPTDMAAIESNTGGNQLDTFLDNLSYGTRIKNVRSYAHESSTVGNQVIVVEFACTYIAKLTGVDGVIEASISEAIKYAGPRFVVQNVPDGYAIVQTIGVEPGSRSVSGSVTAASEATCDAWLEKTIPYPTDAKPGLAFQDGITPPTSANRRIRPPSINIEFIQLPLQDSDNVIGRDSSGDLTSGVRLVKKSFSSEEILTSLVYSKG